MCFVKQTPMLFKSVLADFVADFRFCPNCFCVDEPVSLTQSASVHKAASTAIKHKGELGLAALQRDNTTLPI